MGNKICIVITISLVASSLACEQPPDPFKPGEFKPYKNHDQISVIKGLGMKRGEIGLLEFEDRVCEDDASYAVHLELTHSTTIKDLEPGLIFGGGSRDSCHFVFGGEHNPLSVIASVFQSHVPSITMSPEKSLNIRGMPLSLRDMAAIGQFAFALISFLLKLV